MEELEKKIEESIAKLKVGNSYDDYDSLEFDLLELIVKMSEQEYEYNDAKLIYDKEVINTFNKIREKHKSDVAANRAIELETIESILRLGILKNKIIKTDKKYKGYIRAADHINSRFIKGMADEKRQRLIQEQQTKIIEQSLHN